MAFNHSSNASSNLNPSNIVATPLDPLGASSELSAAVSVTSLDIGASTVPQARSGPGSGIKNGPASYGYSEATEGLLARLSGSTASGSYIEAREHILSSIVTSDKLPALPPITNGARGRGRPKGSGKRKNGTPGSTPASTPGTAKRGRGGGRGRGRGGGRGGKRKRADSEESELSGGDQLSDDSANDDAGQGDSDENTQLPTKTKSGRKVNRPAPFVPVISSPSSNKKKRAYRKNPENAVCKACERGHSPTNNAIVFCDGCGSAYHQYCHNPPIEKDVVQIAEKEWFCVACVKGQPGTPAPPGLEGMNTGQNLSTEEKRAALSALSQAQLIDILLHTSKIYPNLALFPSSPETEIRVEDHYDGYETDPPQHYPRAGNGLAKTLPPESDDMPWLIDDNFDVFTHQVNYQTPVTGTNGSTLTGVLSGIPPNVSERTLHTVTAAPSPAANVPALADVSMGGL